MARFHCLIRPFAALVGGQAVVSARTLRALRLDDGEAPSLQGAGCFDSSWELGRGLDVREGLPGDAGLYEWLDVCLRADEVGAEVAGLGTVAVTTTTITTTTTTTATAAPPQRALRGASLATSRATASPRSITAIA